MDRPWYAHYSPGTPREINIPDRALSDFLTESAQKAPHQVALRFFGRGITFAQLDQLTNRFANALRGLGVQPGERVAIMLPNLPQAVIAYFGALKARAVVVQTNPLYQSAEIALQMADSAARVLVTLDIFRDKVDPVLKGSTLQHVVYCGVRDYLPPLLRTLYPLKAKREGMWKPFEKVAPNHDFLRLLESASTAPQQATPASSDVALLQYTGGTTGVPKGVILTHRNLVANVLQCKVWIDAQAGQDRFLGVIPFFHVYGMTTCQNLAIMVGCEQILLPKFTTMDVLKAIQKFRPTLFPGIQAMYLALGNHPKVKNYDLRSIRGCISGAGPLQAEVQERFESLTGATVVEGYGLSEASPVTHANPLLGKRVKGAIGLPMPSTDARIVHMETGADLPVGEIGELVVQGPQVMQGYWNRPDETRDTIKDGWLRTGDMGRMDADGFFYLVDRKKDMIKTGGENVYPRDVEEVLFRHPKVKEAVIAGLPDKFLGEKIKAYVVLAEGQSATAEDITSFCAEHLAKFKVPREVEFRKELPKTIVGKVLRRVLLDEEAKKHGGAAG
ncbi:MAG: long-chain fatty acid--CoA ligase [Nitrospirota bacterium]|nr:long-chain fatty acid--CoA ligase [Nitrospirota bacterium]